MLTSIKLENYNCVLLKLCDSEPLQVQALNLLYFVWSRHKNSWCMCDRASYMKMTRGTNLMQKSWFIIINISTCFGHLYAHLQEHSQCAAAYGVQHCER